MKAAHKGIFVFVVICIGFYILWIRYEKDLRRETAPPSSYAKIDQFKAQGVPVFETIKTDGSPYSLEQLKGKVLIISFWATWCAPCIEEFPSMMRMLDQLPDIVMVGISADQSQKEVDEFVKNFGGLGRANFVSLWDPSLRVAEMYGTEKIPENYIVGRDFKLIKKFSSIERWDSPEMIEFLRSL